MLASAAYLNSDDFLRYEGKPERAVPDSGQYGLHALYRLYRAREGGWVFLACLTDEEWTGLCKAIGHPEWLNDARFRTAEDREANQVSLTSLLEPVFMQRHSAEWEEFLQSRDVPCAAAERTWWEFLFGSDNSAGRPEFTTAYELPGLGQFEQAGMTVNLLKTPGKLGVISPIGSDSRAILTELGYSGDQSDELKSRGVVHWESLQPSGVA